MDRSRFCRSRKKRLEFHAPDDLVDYVAIVSDKKIRRKGMDVVFLCQVLSLTFLHVDPQIDKIFVEECSGVFLGKHIAVHPFTRSAPGGICIEENKLVLFL